MDRAESVNTDPETTDSEGRCKRWRNQVGFGLLGLCNNFAYVAMLSAAHDILKQQESHNATVTTKAPVLVQFESSNSTSGGRYDCNPVSTAAVLLADILPTLVIKMFAPFFIHKVPYGFRVLLCVATATVSFLLVSFSTSVGMSIIGVICASVSSGLGELSFLSLTVYFDSNILSGWGSGTGLAGVLGALGYSGLTQAGLTPRNTLLIMLIVPVIMLFSYFVLLVFPPLFPQWKPRETWPTVSTGGRDGQETEALMQNDEVEEEEEEEEEEKEEHNNQTGLLSCTEKLHVLKHLLRFVVPLGLVYFAEYFINQGLLELFYFRDSYLSHAEQYRWYQTTYQVGVFASRTSLFFMKIRKVWLTSVLQCANAILLLFSVYYQFLPIWGLFVIIVYEGLLGGAAYVNIFYLIRTETGEREREFAMAAASVGDSFGIALSGAAAFPVHNYFCSL